MGNNFINSIANLNDAYELLNKKKENLRRNRIELIRLKQNSWAKFNNMPLPWYLKDKIFNNLNPYCRNLYFEWIENINYSHTCIIIFCINFSISIIFC